MGISIDKIKNEIKKSGSNRGKFLYVKDGDKVRVRFLTDFEDGEEILFHDSFALSVNVPCQEIFGRNCEYCDNDDLRTRSQYAWSVYDYESKEVKILMAPVNNCSPVIPLSAMYENYGTITDRDYEIKRIGSGQNTTYALFPLEKKKFRNEKVRALSRSALLKYIDKAYPADNDIDDFDDDEETRRPEKKKSAKVDTKKKAQEDEWDDEEESMDYEDMTAKELYTLCKEKGITCQPRQKKNYYIDLLEADDEEADDDWSDEDDDDDTLPFQ